MVLVSSSACTSCSRATGLPGSPAHFPPLYAVEQYIEQEGVRHDVLRFFCTARLFRALVCTAQRSSSRHCSVCMVKKMEALGPKRRFAVPYGKIGNGYFSCFPCRKVEYQKLLASMLADWRRGGDVPTAPNVACSCLDGDWSRLRLVDKLRSWAREHHSQTPLRMRHSVLVGWHNVEIFLVMPAGRSALYPILPS